MIHDWRKAFEAILSQRRHHRESTTSTLITYKHRRHVMATVHFISQLLMALLFISMGTVSFGHRHAPHSAAVSTNSCLTDWLVGAGIPASKAGLYEGKFREGNMQIGKIGHFTPYILRLMGIASGEHQKLILDCASKQCRRPCRHGGVCSVVDRAYTCQCMIGFTGARCEVHPCHPNPCVHQGERSGKCERNATSTSGFTCKCSPGYEGKRCHKITNKCDPDPCLNGATCIVKRKGLVNDFHCFCGPHHHGKICEHKWISRIDYERLKTGIAQTTKNLAKFKSFMHLLFAGWKRRFSCIYQVFKERKTWHQAEKSCASFGGHLTSIHSREEEQFIINHVVKQTSGYLWIGGSDEAVEGAWKWTDGSPVDFFNWATSEPNGAYGENCLELLKHPDPSRKPPSWWNDYPCSLTTNRLDAYLCKVCLKV